MIRKLSIRNKPANDNTQKKEMVVKTRPKSVLEAFENIVELSEDSGLNEDFFKNAEVHIRYAVRKLKLTPLQIVLLALFVDRSEDRRIMMSEIAKYTGCRTTRLLRLAGDIDVLEQKRYIRASRNKNSLTFRVPQQVITSLRNGQPFVYEEEKVTDTQMFFDRFNEAMNEKKNNELTYDGLQSRVEEMLEEIKDSAFARNLKSFGMDDDDTLLFIFMAHLFIENNDDNIRFHDIEDLFDDDNIPSWQKRQLRNRDSDLFEYKLIENVNEDGMACSDAFKLTDYAKQEVLSELNLKNVGRSLNGLIRHNTLAAKKLVFNKAEDTQIAELCSILTHERFKEVQRRLEEAGMRKGFCCLFYGAPGTGKTETVYQLARQTGRDILRVDVDKIKSCWVGESEKNIKALFDRYRSVCRNTERAPILLFNEADAVLGVRMEGASRAVDKMENSIQNIILQEMETLEGIMIATTNLTNNLDSAFERRFLYKIRYNKPGVESRSQIWQIMLPGLKDEEAHKIASQFDLSGGQIENIVRKHSVNAILSGSEIIDLPTIMEACRSERLSEDRQTRIGYC